MKSQLYQILGLTVHAWGRGVPEGNFADNAATEASGRGSQIPQRPQAMKTKHISEWPDGKRQGWTGSKESGAHQVSTSSFRKSPIRNFVSQIVRRQNS